MIWIVAIAGAALSSLIDLKWWPNESKLHSTIIYCFAVVVGYIIGKIDEK